MHNVLDAPGKLASLKTKLTNLYENAAVDDPTVHQELCLYFIETFLESENTQEKQDVLLTMTWTLTFTIQGVAKIYLLVTLL